MVVDRKNKNALALVGLASGPVPDVVNSSVLPTELAAEPITDEVVESKFSNLNFLPSTKKTTEFSFELLLSIYRYFIFFSQVLNFTSVELNRFAKQAKLNLFFKSDGGRAISRQEKQWLRKSTARFPTKTNKQQQALFA